MKNTKAYLAHSKHDYGSEYIKNTAVDIIDEFKKNGVDCEIIDPSKVIVHESEKGTENYFAVMVEYFYPLIDSCGTLVAIPDSRNNNFSTGVITEIRHAMSMGKEIIRIE